MPRSHPVEETQSSVLYTRRSTCAPTPAHKIDEQIFFKKLTKANLYSNETDCLVLQKEIWDECLTPKEYTIFGALPS